MCSYSQGRKVATPIVQHYNSFTVTLRLEVLLEANNGIFSVGETWPGQAALAALVSISISEGGNKFHHLTLQIFAWATTRFDPPEKHGPRAKGETEIPNIS